MNVMPMSKSFLFLLGLVVTFGAPTALSAADEKSEEKVEKITYDDHILPIFRQRCGSCHNANDAKGGLVLDTYLGVIEGGGSGNVIEKGDAGSSYLYMLVTHDSEPIMPPGQPKIPDTELSMIQKWIDLGALENQGSKIVKKKNDLAKIEISTERPASAPVMPDGMTLNPVIVTSMPNSVTALAASPWAPLAAVSGHEQVLLYHTQTGQLEGVLPFPEGVPQVLKFSRNGELLLVGGGRGGANGQVVLFDVKTGSRVAVLGNEYDSVLAADISADHTQVALAGPKRIVRVYSVQSGEMMYELKKHTDWVLALEFSPDGVLLATGDRSNGMFLWEALTGNEYLSLKGHTGAITDISWRPDSNLVASSSEDGTIRLWELNNGKEVKRWNAHGGGVSAMDFTREANIVSIGRDRQAKLWQADGKNLKSYGGLKDVGLEVAYDAELKQVLGGDWLGEVRVWGADSGSHHYSIHANPPAMSEQLAALSQKVAEAGKQVASNEQQIASIRSAVEKRKAAVAAGQAKLKELQTAHAKAEQAKQAADKAAAEQQNAVKAAQTENEKIGKELQQAVNARKAADENAAKLQQAANQAAQAEQQAKQAVDAAQKQIETLKQQGEEAKEALTKAEAALVTAQADVTKRSQELASARQAADNAQKAAAAAKSAVDNLTAKQQAVAQKIDQATKSMQKAQADSKAQAGSIGKLAGQVESQKKAIAEAEKKAAPTDDEKKKLAELEQTLKQHASLKGLLEQHAKELKQQIDSGAQASAK